MRVLHFSDVHVGAAFRRAPFRCWLGKRALGGANLWLRRRRHFDEAEGKLAALDRFRRDRAIDLVICTGDYTALGLPAEFTAARAAVQPLMEAPLGYVNVPGNHDLYVGDVLREGWFERSFGDTLHGDLPETRIDGHWPLVRLLDGVAVVAVNSARPNPQPWRSSGRIPEAQLGALSELLAHERLRDRFLFVITHYAPRLADGSPDDRLHGMVNADAFLRACAGVRRGAILCGHLHRAFHLRLPGVAPPIFCAGSATYAGREGGWVFDVENDRVEAVPLCWSGTGYDLDEPRRLSLG